MLTHQEMVRDCHETYIRASAEVIIANTFSAGWHVLESAGAGDHVSQINKDAIKLAMQALCFLSKMIRYH